MPFSAQTIEKLKHYVYRLIDPRTGLTFYVGQGQGNRVFDHARNALSFSQSNDDKAAETEESAKIGTIRQIIAEGLEVLYVIHRHGLTKSEANQVEGALIDAYGGLTNIQNGIGSNDFGIANAEELERRYMAQEYDDPGNINYLIIKVKKSTIEQHGLDYYAAMRGDWRLSINRAREYNYALCAVDGIVKKVYKIDRWDAVDNGRIRFTGREAEAVVSQLFVDKRLPNRYIKRGMAAPVLYCNNQ